MKQLGYLSFLLLGTINAMANTLMPSSHYVCETYRTEGRMTICCIGGRDFYTDQYGRCGCVQKQAIMPLEACSSGLVNCTEEFTYANLYQDQVSMDTTATVQVGCGCFATER